MKETLYNFRNCKFRATIEASLFLVDLFCLLTWCGKFDVKTYSYLLFICVSRGLQEAFCFLQSFPSFCRKPFRCN